MKKDLKNKLYCVLWVDIQTDQLIDLKSALNPTLILNLGIQKSKEIAIRLITKYLKQDNFK